LSRKLKTSENDPRNHYFLYVPENAFATISFSGTHAPDREKYLATPKTNLAKDLRALLLGAWSLGTCSSQGSTFPAHVCSPLNSANPLFFNFTTKALDY
jgi:hypothetical protein